MLNEPGAKRVDPTDRLHDVHSKDYYGGHLDHELNQVSPQHRPEPGGNRIHYGDNETDSDGEHRRDAERYREDFDHRPRHPAEDDQVDWYREVECAESAEEPGRRATVAYLGEFNVGHNVGAPPQPGEEEHREHSAHHHVPPQPVSGDTVRDHEAGDHERRVGSEGRRDHGCARQPPADVSSGEKILVETFAASFGEHQPDYG